MELATTVQGSTDRNADQSLSKNIRPTFPQPSFMPRASGLIAGRRISAHAQTNRQVAAAAVTQEPCDDNDTLLPPNVDELKDAR